MLSLIVILLLSALILSAIVIFLMAYTLLRPPRMTDGKAAYILKRLSPGDLELNFEDMRFDVRDERTGNLLHLAAWWIPHANANGKCVILIHGYADAKVGGIAWAPTFHGLGYNILALDLRAHGESDGAQTTAGFYERHDLNQVINQLRAARPNSTRHMVLFGVSLGAAVVASTAVLRDDLAAVVLESPFSDFVTAAKAHARQMGLPGEWLQTPAIRLAERLSGADFSQVRPIDLIPQIPCPMLVFQSADDMFLPDGDAERIARAVASRPSSLGPSLCHNIPAHHATALAYDPEAYRRLLREFLNEVMNKTEKLSRRWGMDEHG